MVFSFVITMYFLSTCMGKGTKPHAKGYKNKKENTPAERRLNYNKAYT